MGQEDEIDYYDQEIQELLEDIEKDLNSLQRLKGPKRENKLATVTERVQRAKDDLRSFNVEMRDMPKERALPYEKKYKDYDERLKQMSSELKWQRTAAIQMTMNGPGDGPSGDADGSAPAGQRTLTRRQQERLDAERMRAMEEADPDALTAKQLIDVASNVQDKSKKALLRSQRLGNEAKEIGTTTTVKLKEQTDQMRRIGDKVDEVESNLKRADKQIRIMLRGVARDKIAIGLIVIILGCIGFIIYWKVAKKPGSEQIIIPGLGSYTASPLPTSTLQQT